MSCCGVTSVAADDSRMPIVLGWPAVAATVERLAGTTGADLPRRHRRRMGDLPVGEPMTAAANITNGALPEECTTRPGTPMIGPFSVNQMDDFYTAFANGLVKPSGVMNLAQRLFIAER